MEEIVVTYDPNADPVMRAGLAAIGAIIREELEPGTAFALFVDWRDGKPPSYLANAPRDAVARALAEWLDHVAGLPPVRGGSPDPARPGAVPLEVQCATIARALHEEEVDVALFLFGGQPSADGFQGDTAWSVTFPGARRVVEGFIATQRRKS